MQQQRQHVLDRAIIKLRHVDCVQLLGPPVLDAAMTQETSLLQASAADLLDQVAWENKGCCLLHQLPVQRRNTPHRNFQNQRFDWQLHPAEEVSFLFAGSHLSQVLPSRTISNKCCCQLSSFPLRHSLKATCTTEFKRETHA